MQNEQAEVRELFVVFGRVRESTQRRVKPAGKTVSSYNLAVGAYYITTDLDVRARFNPVALDEELRRAGLHGGVRECEGYWHGGYSCGECVYHPTSGLRHLLSIAENLGNEARAMWDGCYSRRFDMGFECFDERFASNWQVNARLMRRLADVNGDLVMTVYRADNPREVT